MLRRGVFGWALALCLLAPGISFGQIINTVVGNAINNNLPALQTPLVRPAGLAIDNNGRLIIADRGNFVIRRVSGGIATVIAGGGNIFDDAIPVPGTSAALDFPYFLAAAADGTIYFSDFNDYRIRKITPAGTVTTVAGTGDYGYYGDGGKATLADISAPRGIALDSTRNLLYFADTYNSVIRRVNLNTGIIDTFAGNGFPGYSGDGGPATSAELNYPEGIAVDSAGNVYITDVDDVDYYGLIRKVNLAGTISTLVPPSATLNGSHLYDRSSLAFDPSGNLYVADFWSYRVLRVGPTGVLTLYAGGGPPNSLPVENVPSTSQDLYEPSGIVFDAAGNMYVSESGWDIVRRVAAGSNLISTFAGSVTNVLDGGPALSAPLDYPRGLAMSAAGDLYIADQFHNRIRKVSPATGGTITTVIGNGVEFSNVDAVLSGAGTTEFPRGVALDATGANLYFTEASTVVRKLNLTTRQLSTVAGQRYVYGYFGDNGPATSAELADPWQPLVAPNGDVYISDTNNHCVRRVRSGIITRVAGICSPGTDGGYSGDGGQAIQAQLSYPTGLAFDLNGNLLIADSGNSIVRRLTLSSGVITRVAGTPQSYGFSGDLGSPLAAEMGSPAWLAVDSTGRIFISDGGTNALRIIRNGIIDTLAGVWEPGFAGDGGKSIFAWLNYPSGLALDASGNLFLSDAENNRVRKITLAGVAPPTLKVIPASLSFRVVQGGESPPGQLLKIENTGAFQLGWQYDLRLPPAGSGTFTGGGWLYLTGFDGGFAVVHRGVEPNPNGVAIPAGTCQGQVVVIAPGANGSPVTIPVTLIIDPPATAKLAISNSSMSFQAAQGGAAPASQILSISNTGSGPLSWQANAVMFRGSNWLTLSRTSATVQAGGSASTISVTANPSGLSPGYYVGRITVNNQTSGGSATVEVSLNVASSPATILLSSSNFLFLVTQGSNFVPTQSLQILNSGQGQMSWQLQTTVQQGNWLRTSVTSGVSDGGNLVNSQTVILTADPSGLAPGTYGGVIQVQSAGARNNPQSASVLLRVLPAGSPPIPQVLPSGLTFDSNTGGASQTKELTVRTTGGGLLNYGVGIKTQDGGAWLTASPSAGSLASSGDQPKIRVQVSPGTLPAGVYRGSVTIAFSNGKVLDASVVMILHAPTSFSTSAGGNTPGAGCVPSAQVIQSTRMGNNFDLITGWPAQIIAGVTDNCGIPLFNSTVVASFNNNDPAIVLTNLGGGIYSATWVPTKTAPGGGGVQVTIRSLNPSLPESTFVLVGSVATDSTNPVIGDSGIVNAANFFANRPISPGSIATIFGTDLASAGSCFGGNCIEAFPLPTTLGGASVKIGGRDAPLIYAGPSQINFQVPSDLTNVSSADVVVATRGVISAPRSMQVDGSQPGIFVTGGTQGAVLNQDSSINAPSRPAGRGSFIQIYVTGLGATNPAVATGAPAPSVQPFANVVNPATVTIGGVQATPIFQAMAPGYAGLYQINVQVPSSVTPGAAVTLKITQNGVDSNQVTFAVN